MPAKGYASRGLVHNEHCWTTIDPRCYQQATLVCCTTWAWCLHQARLGRGPREAPRTQWACGGRRRVVVHVCRNVPQGKLGYLRHPSGEDEAWREGL